MKARILIAFFLIRLPCSLLGGEAPANVPADAVKAAREFKFGNVAFLMKRSEFKKLYPTADCIRDPVQGNLYSVKLNDKRAEYAFVDGVLQAIRLRYDASNATQYGGLDGLVTRLKGKYGEPTRTSNDEGDISYTWLIVYDEGGLMIVAEEDPWRTSTTTVTFANLTKGERAITPELSIVLNIKPRNAAATEELAEDSSRRRTSIRGLRHRDTGALIPGDPVFVNSLENIVTINSDDGRQLRIPFTRVKEEDLELLLRWWTDRVNYIVIADTIVYLPFRERIYVRLRDAQVLQVIDEQNMLVTGTHPLSKRHETVWVMVVSTRGYYDNKPFVGSLLVFGIEQYENAVAGTRTVRKATITQEVNLSFREWLKYRR